ncbi:M15 family metallopeptidase [Stenotrophomonas mori]|uniref:D-alanyl-D-alanine carboxypeptidase family protein n=1 Tax=Stenotrophomonas mori TaxID=2871096 RepID=A0ABT0SGA7_9GAMM|nr:M15 family metallopeptidase [Stenotrophomonas mori]MCL7714360.1 D-alanyl-D-alanine carboxypeptidase family protein [Stenotrophomonas mori]
MRTAPRLLLNTPDIELWPGGLLRARSSHDARLLARARTVLRRKQDGRYLAALLPEGLMPMVERLAREPGIDAALQRLDDPLRRRGTPAETLLPLDRLDEHLHRLGLDEGYADASGLSLVAEPSWLCFAGLDRYRRALWLTRAAAHAWRRLRTAAAADGIVLDAVSGYRSHAYQLGIFERKRARGLSVAEILTVNAAPGYSEHHGGNALDIGTPGEPPAEESFERTPAFAWLRAHAGDAGFHMSYPRDNPHGIVYEPWHWCWRGT